MPWSTRGQSTSGISITEHTRDHYAVCSELSQMPQIKDLLAKADVSDSLAQARQSSSTWT